MLGRKQRSGTSKKKELLPVQSDFPLEKLPMLFESYTVQTFPTITGKHLHNQAEFLYLRIIKYLSVSSTGVPDPPYPHQQP